MKLKKSTYALIILAVLPFVLIPAFLLIVRVPYNSSDHYLYRSVQVSGDAKEQALAPFTSVRMEIGVGRNHYCDDPVLNVNLGSDRPGVAMAEGWERYVSYTIEDSTLVVTLNHTSEVDFQNSSLPTIYAPSLANIDNQTHLEFTIMGDADSLHAYSRGDIYLKDARLGSLDIICPRDGDEGTKYRYDVYMYSAELGKLSFTGADNLRVSFNQGDCSLDAVDFTLLRGREEISDLSLPPAFKGEVKVHGNDQRVGINISTDKTITIQ